MTFNKEELANLNLSNTNQNANFNNNNQSNCNQLNLNFNLDLNNSSEKETVKTLDTLFKKTNSRPNIYYLPLSEEEVNNI